MNAVLVEKFVAVVPLGSVFVILTLISEGALLVVGAQAGFVDGPRVIANMAIDSWMPRRFGTLSERLTTQNGIVLMGAAALAALLYTGGDIRHIVVMYSINVFLTFSLTTLGMFRFWYRGRRQYANWKKESAIQLLGLALCATIFCVTVYEKFGEGGWITLIVTGSIVVLCFRIRRHYRTINAKLKSLFAALVDIPRVADVPPGPVDPSKPTAAVLVGGYSGLGIHTTLSAFRTFPQQFKNVVFISVGVVDSAAIREEDSLDRLRDKTQKELMKYVDLIGGQGMPATYRMAIGTDVVAELDRVCLEVARDFPQVTFFAGQLVFQRERWYQPILHNETAFGLQKRLQLAGYTVVIIPARMQ